MWVRLTAWGYPGLGRCPTLGCSSVRDTVPPQSEGNTMRTWYRQGYEKPDQALAAL
jgi:hypothetical protein